MMAVNIENQMQRRIIKPTRTNKYTQRVVKDVSNYQVYF